MQIKEQASDGEQQEIEQVLSLPIEIFELLEVRRMERQRLLDRGHPIHRQGPSWVQQLSFEVKLLLPQLCLRVKPPVLHDGRVGAEARLQQHQDHQEIDVFFFKIVGTFSSLIHDHALAYIYIYTVYTFLPSYRTRTHDLGRRRVNPKPRALGCRPFPGS